MNPARRKLLLNLRRKVKAQRQHEVTNLANGTVRLKCRTCGHERVDDMSDVPEAFRDRFARYWADPNSSLTAECPVCLKAERDRRFPLRRE